LSGHLIATDSNFLMVVDKHPLPCFYASPPEIAEGISLWCVFLRESPKEFIKVTLEVTVVRCPPRHNRRGKLGAGYTVHNMCQLRVSPETFFTEKEAMLFLNTPHER